MSNIVDKFMKTKQVNVLLWFVVAVIMVVVGGVIYFVWGLLHPSTKPPMPAMAVSLSELKLMSARVVNEYVAFSDDYTRIFDTLSKGGALFGKNYLVQSSISCVEIGYDFGESGDSWIKCNGDTLTINLGKPKVLNTIPVGETKPLIVRFESYIRSDGDWTPEEKMELQKKANEHMFRICEEKGYYQEAQKMARQQIQSIVQKQLTEWNKSDVVTKID